MDRSFGLITGGGCPVCGGGGPRLKRNNTSFPVRSTAMLRALYKKYVADAAAGDPSATLLKYYQYYVREFMMNPEYGIGASGGSRGLLIYHEPGTGKTRIAAAVAMAVWDVRPPVLVLPRSLYKNLKNEVAAVVAAMNPGLGADALKTLQDTAISRFRFVSSDAYNMADQVTRIAGDLSGGPGSLDGKLLIVDEAHNLFRAIINSGSENTNARRLYDMVQEAKNLRILFLTGTPASKDPFELVPCFNMLVGSDLLPPQYETFVRLYVDKARRKVKNRERLANRIIGMVSHVSPSLPSVPASESGESAPVKKPRSDGGFPAQLPTIIERIEMSRDQYRQYLLAREKELAEGKGGEGGPRVDNISGGPALALPGSEKKAMRSYYVHSRSLSNFAAPREFADVRVEKMPDSAFTRETSPKSHRIVENINKSPGSALVYSQFVDIGGLRVVSRYLRKDGFEEFVAPSKGRPAKKEDSITAAPIVEPMELSSPESPPVVENVLTGGATVVSTVTEEFPGCWYNYDAECVSPASLPVELFSKNGITGGADAHPGSMADTEIPPPKKRFAVISGEVDADSREAIQRVFNSPQNARGGIIRAILISKTGAEGLDLKGLRQIHIFEPYWDKAREDQVIGRGVRLGSHDGLPFDSRDVQPFVYIGVANRHMWDLMPAATRESASIDEIFHARALERYALNLDFRRLLRSVSVECSLFGYGDCRLCVPTESALFHEDFNQDIRLPDPCDAMEPREISAESVQITRADGGTRTYYYIPDPAEVAEFQFFEFRDDLGGYVPVDPSDPAIPAILAAIKIEAK